MCFVEKEEDKTGGGLVGGQGKPWPLTYVKDGLLQTHRLLVAVSNLH